WIPTSGCSGPPWWPGGKSEERVTARADAVRSFLTERPSRSFASVASRSPVGSVSSMNCTRGSMSSENRTGLCMTSLLSVRGGDDASSASYLGVGPLCTRSFHLLSPAPMTLPIPPPPLRRVTSHVTPRTTHVSVPPPQEKFAALSMVGAFAGDADSRFFPRTCRAPSLERDLAGPLLATPSLIAGPFRSGTVPRDEDATSRRRRMSLTAGQPKEGRSRVRQGASHEDHIRAAHRRAA